MKFSLGPNKFFQDGLPDSQSLYIRSIPKLNKGARTIATAAVQTGLARTKFLPLPAPINFYKVDKDTAEYVGL